jgi:hypothetical protein
MPQSRFHPALVPEPREGMGDSFARFVSNFVELWNLARVHRLEPVMPEITGQTAWLRSASAENFGARDLADNFMRSGQNFGHAKRE